MTSQKIYRRDEVTFPSSWSPEEKLTLCRTMASRMAPYFQTALFALRPRPVGTPIGTLGVTRSGIMYYDPAVFEKWTAAEVAAVLLHEVNHIIRDHADRAEALGAAKDNRPTSTSMLWNIAGDCEINDDLGLYPLPQEAVSPETFALEDGQIAEWYFHKLQKKQPPQQANCGSCSGAPSEEEQKLQDAGELPQPGSKEESEQGLSKPRLEQIKDETARQVQEHQKAQGNVPYGLQCWAEARLKPQIDWRKRLARLVRRACAYKSGAVDYCSTKISRRQWGVGFGPRRPLLPAFHQPIPNVVVAIDTSGSMGCNDALGRALSELDGLLKTLQTSVQILIADCEVTEARCALRWQDIQEHLTGGGGTSFVPVFEYMASRSITPDCLIYMTDGWGDAPAKPPPFPVVWAITNPEGAKPAEWGDCVIVKDEEQ